MGEMQEEPVRWRSMWESDDLADKMHMGTSQDEGLPAVMEKVSREKKTEEM